MTVLNISHVNRVLKEEQCVVRGISSEQSCTEVPVNASVFSNEDRLCRDKLLVVVGEVDKCKSCFATNNSELGNTSVEMKINLTSNVPVCYKPYYERDLVRHIVADLLENDIIEPTISEYASPILLAKKKTGDVRMRLLSKT